MADAKCAHYDLEKIKYLVLERRYQVTRRAGIDAETLGFDEEDICECVRQLTPQCFHKSMPSQTKLGTYQDVYYTTYCDEHLYVKLQIADTEDAIVISFHRNTSQ
jgi:hypothetical protein